MLCRSTSRLCSRPTPLRYLYITYCCCWQLHSAQQQQYAADTQLYITLTLLDPSELAANKSCLASLQLWFYMNGMALNPDKMHAILFVTAQWAQLFQCAKLHWCCWFSHSTLDSHIKLLWVTQDSHLSVSEHIKLMSLSCYIIFRHCITFVVC